jgi:hypothetical protein
MIHIYIHYIYGLAQDTCHFVGFQQLTGCPLFPPAATQRLLFQLLCFASSLRSLLQAHHYV